LEDSKDINEILRAQGGIAALREFEGNIKNIIRDLNNLKNIQLGNDPYITRGGRS
jgi:hypothetical protein